MLSAKSLNPKLHIVARARDENAAEKLRKVGADQTVNPYSIGGARLAQQMLNPNVIEFMESDFFSGASDFSVKKIPIAEDGKCHNKSLTELDIRKKSGATIIAVVRGAKPTSNPGGSFRVAVGDRLVAMGTREQLKKLEELI